MTTRPESRSATQKRRQLEALRKRQVDEEIWRCPVVDLANMIVAIQPMRAPINQVVYLDIVVGPGGVRQHEA